MPKGEKRPAIERVDNVLNITTLCDNITKSQNNLRTADEAHKIVVAAIGDRMTDQIRESLETQYGLGPQYNELREQTGKLCVAMRIAIKAVEEGANAQDAKKLAQWMLANGFFKPAPEVKKD